MSINKTKTLMKRIILILTVSVFLFSCGTKVNYVKDTGSSEIKEPFKAKDFQDTDTEFYSIRNSVGTNLNAIKAESLAAAQADFSQRIVVALKSIAELKLTNKDEASTSDFNLKLNGIGSNTIKKIKIVDSKIYTRGNQKGSTNTKYDYWAVYKVELAEVVKLANSSNLGFEVTTEDF
jgi:hypothetical protein